MPDLSAQSMPSGDDLLADNHAAAHAGSQGDHDKVAVALSAALPHLAQGRHIGVIAALYGNAVQKL